MTVQPTVTVRDATQADLAAIVLIERACFSDPWTLGMFRAHLPPRSSDVFLVAVDAHDAVAGFAIARAGGAESELFNVAVDAGVRRGRVGTVLLDAIVGRVSALGATEMWLEVRVSNTAALSLYRRRGFIVAGNRKQYYQAPREDALVLRAPITAPGDSPGDDSIQRDGAGLARPLSACILSSASQPSRQETL